MCLLCKILRIKPLEKICVYISAHQNYHRIKKHYKCILNSKVVAVLELSSHPENNKGPELRTLS